MAFNVFALSGLKSRYTLFKNDHPDVMPFLQSLAGKVQEGATIELSMTDPSGAKVSKAFTLNKNDVESYNQIKNLKK